MNQLIDDKTFYQPLNKDPTYKYQSLSNKLIDKLCEEKIIETKEKKMLKRYNSLPPKLYGLRKVHKKTICYRPIVSCINSPCYNLAKIVHKILHPITTTFPYNVSNSIDLVKTLNTVTLPNNYVLVSFDVTSLFTNIPKELVIKIIKEKWQFISSYTTLSKSLLIELIEHCFDTSYFVFNKKFFKQIDGTAMGNPLSPVLANFVMTHLLETVIRQLEFPVPLIHLYVDDTLLALPSDKIDLVLGKLQNFNKKLKFTYEIEDNNHSIPFLDIWLTRNIDGTIITNWYTKPSASNRILNFLSNHPWHQKLSLLRNIYLKMLQLSHPKFYNENFIKIHNILKLNNYPSKLINKIKYDCKETSSRLNKNKTQRINKRHYKFPYFPEIINKINSIFKDTGCSIVGYNLKTVGNTIFTNLKDKVPTLQKAELVYSIPCGNCSKVYIGQTKQYLKNRLSQHKYDCRLTNLYNSDKTSLATHHFTTGHNFDFENVKIVDMETNHIKRNISEMLHIKINNTVNKNTDTDGLSHIYVNLLNDFKCNIK